MTEPAPAATETGQYGVIARFLFSGAVNTLLTYLLYLFLLSTLGHRLAYSVAFASGIGLAYLVNRIFVFKAHAGWRSALAMPLIYLVQYLLGMAIIELWIEVLGLQPTLGPLAAIAVTVPLVFALSRLAFLPGQAARRKG